MSTVYTCAYDEKGHPHWVSVDRATFEEVYKAWKQQFEIHAPPAVNSEKDEKYKRNPSPWDLAEAKAWYEQSVPEESRSLVKFGTPIFELSDYGDLKKQTKYIVHCENDGCDGVHFDMHCPAKCARFRKQIIWGLDQGVYGLGMLCTCGAPTHPYKIDQAAIERNCVVHQSCIVERTMETARLYEIECAKKHKLLNTLKPPKCGHKLCSVEAAYRRYQQYAEKTICMECGQTLRSRATIRTPPEDVCQCLLEGRDPSLPL
jgi:hypothetical protein